ncbi:MAG: ribonuclease H [Chloroflexota bacterium]
MTTSSSFTCERCSRAFKLSAETLARYPGWVPKLCSDCRSATKGASTRGGTRSSASRGSGARSSSSGGGGGSTRGVLHTTAQVLERYSGGPQTGVFTDGSCSGNPGPGGWGAVRVLDGEVVDARHGDDPDTTNNRMELVAIAQGIEMIGPGETLDVYTDSRLVVQTLTQWAAGWERRGWKRSTGEVQNLELVQRAFSLAKSRPHVRIQWIRAHDGSKWNEYADALATAYLRTTL